jgi:hypothetical protein
MVAVLFSIPLMCNILPLGEKTSNFLKKSGFGGFFLLDFSKKRKSEKSPDFYTMLRYVGPRMFRFF